MKITFLSTYLVQCGIASYTRNLAQALASRGHEVHVLAEHDKDSVRGANATFMDGPVYVQRCWSRQYDYGHPLSLYGAGAFVQGVLHIQHEFGLFKTADLAEFTKGTTPVVTLHTVERRRDFMRYLQNTKPIVHSMEASAIVDGTVIPHGVEVIENVDNDEILVPGFVSKSKNTLEILEAYVIAIDRGLKLKLKVQGLCRDDEYSGKLREFVSKSGIEDRVELNLNYVNDQEARQSLSRATCVVLGNGPTSPYSASGQLHSAVGAGVPVIAKSVPIYRTLPGAGVLFYEDAKSCANFMLAMQGSLRDRLSERNKKIRTHYLWSAVAAMTEKMYS